MSEDGEEVFGTREGEREREWNQLDSVVLSATFEVRSSRRATSNRRSESSRKRCFQTWSPMFWSLEESGGYIISGVMV